MEAPISLDQEYHDLLKDAPLWVISAFNEYKKLPSASLKRMPFLYFLLNKGTNPAKLPKAFVLYTEKEIIKSQNCANCVHSYKHNTSGRFICDQMRGWIKPKAWCKLWKPH